MFLVFRGLASRVLTRLQPAGLIKARPLPFALFSENDEVTQLNYPVLEYPKKVKSLNFDKTQIIRGRLVGIKAQYLLFDGGEVINIRRYTVVQLVSYCGRLVC